MNLNEHTNSNDFLKGLKKENPFKTPDNYFDNISENITSVQNLKNKVESPGFKTPENYFTDFKVKEPFKIIKLIPYISIAAAIVIGAFVFKNSNTSSLNTNLTEDIELNNNEILEYLAYEDDMELEEIINYSSEIEFENLNTEF